jgi:hypothetical protein
VTAASEASAGIDGSNGLGGGDCGASSSSSATTTAASVEAAARRRRCARVGGGRDGGSGGGACSCATNPLLKAVVHVCFADSSAATQAQPRQSVANFIRCGGAARAVHTPPIGFGKGGRPNWDW